MANKINLNNLLKGKRINRGLMWGLLILGALIAFETFNYSTTEFALSDLLGDLRFAGLSWSTILALAFCGIDFAGIARLFTPETASDEPKEVWYLFAAWLLAATMNASLTWWGVSIAIASNASLGSTVVPRETLLRVVPFFVAAIVWLIRVLIIGTFSVAGERLFSQDDSPTARRGITTALHPSTIIQRRPARSYSRPISRPRPAAQPSFSASRSSRPEPTYHPLGMEAKSSGESHNSDYAA